MLTIDSAWNALLLGFHLASSFLSLRSQLKSHILTRTFPDCPTQGYSLLEPTNIALLSLIFLIVLIIIWGDHYLFIHVNCFSPKLREKRIKEFCHQGGFPSPPQATSDHSVLLLISTSPCHFSFVTQLTVAICFPILVLLHKFHEVGATVCYLINQCIATGLPAYGKYSINTFLNRRITGEWERIGNKKAEKGKQK